MKLEDAVRESNDREVSDAPIQSAPAEHGQALDRTTVAETPSRTLLGWLSSSEQGLSPAQVDQRTALYGPNTLIGEKITALGVLLRQFRSALIYVLVVAAILSFATQDLSDGVIITAILLTNAGLGFSQEYRSERAVEKLSHLIASRVLVKREGRSALIDVAMLVPGDIVILKEGDVVPADIKLLSAEDVEVDESQLTGESIPVTKIAQPPASGGDASLVFMGSTVDRGELTGMVYATASHTELGRIATLSSSIRKSTQYEKSLRSFSTLLMRMIGVALLATLALKIFLGGGASHITELLVFVIALAVAVIPEALPVIATLTLSWGALKLAKQRVVVKRLSSLEDLGNVTVLCTDKTGTLTENKLTIQRLVSEDGRLFQTLAYAAIDRECGEKRGTQNSFDAAFVAYIPDEIKSEAGTFTIVKELPFDPADRRRRVILADRSTASRYLVVIGSAETLLEMTHCASAAQYLEEIKDEGLQGLRHLGMAYRKLTDFMALDDIPALEKNLAFLGFVTLADPLRASTPHALDTARQLGVKIKVLTGDSPEVAAYIARQVGLLPPGSTVYSGDDLAHMSTQDMERVATQNNVFARVSPEQKYAIIQALKTHEVVGYQGDGINDAPALKLADVAIAVDTATEVAKANADVILLDKDLGVIINAIQYGRAIFANIDKYIKYTMVGNFGNFFALAILYLVAVALPLLPRQVLLISLLTDVPLVAISTDTVSKDDLEQPARYNARSLLSLSLVLGTLTALFELAFYLTLQGQTASARNTSLYLFLSLTQLIVIVSVRNRDHFWKAVKPSRLLIGTMVLCAALAMVIPFLGPSAQLFSFSPPSPMELGVVALTTLLYVVVLDLIKVWHYRTGDRT